MCYTKMNNNVLLANRGIFMALCFVIDRFEGGFGVCLADENDAGIYKLDVPKAKLDGLAEGDVFSADVEGAELTNITALPEETARRREAARSRLRALLEKQKNR